MANTTSINFVSSDRINKTLLLRPHPLRISMPFNDKFHEYKLESCTTCLIGYYKLISSEYILIAMGADTEMQTHTLQTKVIYSNYACTGMQLAHACMV